MRRNLTVCDLSDVMKINLLGKEWESWMQHHLWKLGWIGITGSVGQSLAKASESILWELMAQWNL